MGTHRRCCAEGCVRNGQGPVGVDGKIYCIQHGGISRKCDADGCMKSPVGPKTNGRYLCRTHNGTLKICRMDTCTRRIVVKKTENTTGYCLLHSGLLLTCQFSGCKNKPVGKRLADGNKYCRNHGGIPVICERPDCSRRTNGSKTLDGMYVCKHHGGVVAVRMCSVNDCSNPSITKKTKDPQLCSTHMRNPRRCTFLNCEVICKGKLIDIKGGILCYKHTPPSRCSVDDCKEMALRCNSLEMHPKCASHKCLEKKSYVCMVPDCNARAKGARESDGLRVCIMHGACPKNTKCANAECNKFGVGRVLEDGKRYCTQHGGVVIYKKKLCEHDGCTKTAASVRSEDGKRYCRKHGKNGRKCSMKDCTKLSIGPKRDNGGYFCLDHGGGFRCKTCQLKFAKSTGSNGGSCTTCSPGFVSYKRNHEHTLFVFLKEMYPEYTIINNKSMGVRCGSYRPDIVFTNLGVPFDIIVEVDEHEHRSYDKDCEITRQVNLFTQEHRSLVLIRYNPHYTALGITRDVKFKRIKDVIDMYIREPPHSDLFYEIRYLYYTKKRSREMIDAMDEKIGTLAIPIADRVFYVV